MPPLLSFRINRFTFESRRAGAQSKERVQTIDGTVTGVDISRSDELHTVTVHDSAQQRHTRRARWLIDATGRNRVSISLDHAPPRWQSLASTWFQDLSKASSLSRIRP